MKKLAMLASVLLLGGCAKSTDELGKAYVSPMIYNDYSCKQLTAEMARLSRRAQELTHSVNENASGDSVAMGVGLILFWPSLFFIDGDNPDAQEYRRIRGEYDAAEQAAIHKDCSAIPSKNPFTEAEKAYKAKQQERNEHSAYPSGRRR